MWKKKVKNKKVQFTLVGAILFAIAVIFSMCLSFTLELKAFTQKALTKENCPDAFIVAIGDTKLKEHIEDRHIADLIASEAPITGREISVPIIYQGQSVSLYYQMMLSATKYQDWGYLWLAEGEEAQPGENEVWIAKKMAISQGIKIGDTITLAYDQPIELSVSGIYKAGFAPAVSNAFAPIVVSDELLNKCGQEKESAIFAINLTDYSVENCFQITDHYSYDKQLLTRNKLQNQVVTFASLISGFGAIAVMIIFLLVLVVIRFIVKNNITREFRDIGIYKSLGYKTKQIKRFYLKGYFYVGLLAVSVGTISAFPLNIFLGKICTKCLDGYHITCISVLCAFFVTILLMIILMLNVKLALRKVEGITPMKAIAVGVTMHEGKISKSVIRHAKSPLGMAINDIFKNKKASAVIVAVFTISLCLCMLFTKIIYSFSNAEKITSKWFAIPENNVYLTGVLNDEVYEYLEQNQLVSNEVHGYLGYAPTVNSDQFDHVSLREVKFDVLSNTTQEKTGVPILKGTNPSLPEEIAITDYLAKKLAVEPGEYIQLQIKDKEQQYLITGTYYSLLSQQGILITEEAMKHLDPSYQTLMDFITLTDISCFEEFKKDIEQSFDSVSADKQWFSMENSISTIKSMMVIISSILIMVFFLFFLINTLIVLLMENANKRFQYGVLKSLGFTSGYMIMQNTLKFILLASVSSGLALMIHLGVADTVLSKIVMNGFLESGGLLSFIIILFFTIVILINRIIGHTIQKITVVELTEE